MFAIVTHRGPPEVIKYLQYNNTFIALLYPIAFSFELLQECCVGVLRIFFPQQLYAASRVSLTDRLFWNPPLPLLTTPHPSLMFIPTLKSWIGLQTHVRADTGTRGVVHFGVFGDYKSQCMTVSWCQCFHQWYFPLFFLVLPAQVQWFNKLAESLVTKLRHLLFVVHCGQTASLAKFASRVPNHTLPLVYFIAASVSQNVHCWLTFIESLTATSPTENRLFITFEPNAQHSVNAG